MGKTTKAANKANKLQEVVLAKTMESLSGNGTKKETPKAKAKPEAEPKKVKASKETKKETPKKETPKKVTKKTETTREVKYIYPDNCNDSLSRKKFRAEVRAKVKQFNKSLEKAGGKESKEGKKVYKEFKEYTSQYLRG